MTNPFYPPNRTSSGRVSRGNINQSQDQLAMPFDPDRRAGSIARLGRGDEQELRYNAQHGHDDDCDDEEATVIHQRYPTDGPGGAASFYPTTYTADRQLGTGTDGFGAGEQKSAAANAAQPDAIENQYILEPDYRSGFHQAGNQSSGKINAKNKGNDHPSIAANGARKTQPANLHPVAAQQTANFDTLVPGRPAYLLPHPDNSNAPPLYNSSSNVSLTHEDEYEYSEKRQVNEQSSGAYTYARPTYPPQNAFGNSQSTFDLRTPFAAAAAAGDRPDTPGIYRDRAPRMEKLTPEQKKIAESFPKDLDEDGGSLIKTFITMCKDWRSFVKWKYAHYYVILAVICALVALMTIYHHQIVDWLTPVSRKIRELSWGWVIPVVILFVISFPPLFGHEIIGVLCGVVYGLWMGFGILSLGTLLGELGNFYAFKFFLRSYGEKYEQKSIDYACMAHIVREGGFIVILLARLSAIPGHFTTAVFATVGMNIFVFTLAAILSLPKQLVVVYLGVAIEQSGSGNESTQSKVIKWIVLIASFLVTVGVAVFLYGKMQKARPIVQERLREKRFNLLTEAAQRSAEDADSGAGHGISASEDGLVSDGGEERKQKYVGQDAFGLENGGSDVQARSKKSSLWSRLMGKGGAKGKSAQANEGRRQGQRRPAYDAHIAMQEVYHRPSYDDTTDSVGHQKTPMAGYVPYQSTHRLSYAQQYMSDHAFDEGEQTLRHIPNPHVHQNADQWQHAYQPRPLPRDEQGQRPLSQEQQPRSQANGSAPRYHHAPNVGSIYNLPDGSVGVTEAAGVENHRNGQSSRHQGGSSGDEAKSAYATAL